eukprot:CAMPEP_0206146764 /NCGR_PEP_ID=MMETSP1473-20131121/31365_1 /ASSEMBLY_ACC=CAM_ASM_001109 /TAXON_ID=1461547 /ORGANISM="Stichococcus sp, Strain RCC1054" /LENGTH=53 /DNA_ID=CAMNT_0053543447 /DNA_START=260 /DNA_END=417 /DNA_ORIENTATION=+
MTLETLSRFADGPAQRSDDAVQSGGISGAAGPADASRDVSASPVQADGAKSPG